MLDSESRRAVEKARKNPSHMRTNEFIHSRLFDDTDLRTMLLEMGPNCNLKCFHCYANCGPNRIGLPSPSITDNAMNQAVRSGVLKVALTDGEPLREENRDAVAAAVEYSKYVDTTIISNGIFADKYEDAIEWISFLKQKGFDLSKAHPALCVSAGSMYPTTQNNFRHINDALKVVYPDADLGNNFDYQFIGTGDIRDTVKRVNDIILTINESFGKRRSERMGKLGEEDAVYCYPEKGSPIKITVGVLEPVGRAADLSLVQKIMPKKVMDLGDLVMETDPVSTFRVFYNGDVHFAHGCSMVGRNRSYGNIKDQHLGFIMHKIRMDPLFQGFKLGGTPLLYHVAKKIDPSFKVEGRVNSDVYVALLENKSRASEIGNYLQKNGVIDSYKTFINSVDLSKSGFNPSRDIAIPQSIFA
ncbi:MAG: hypothetical protein WCK29_03370 [archaeon]